MRAIIPSCCNSHLISCLPYSYCPFNAFFSFFPFLLCLLSFLTAFMHVLGLSLKSSCSSYAQDLPSRVSLCELCSPLLSVLSWSSHVARRAGIFTVNSRPFSSRMSPSTAPVLQRNQSVPSVATGIRRSTDLPPCASRSTVQNVGITFHLPPSCIHMLGWDCFAFSTLVRRGFWCLHCTVLRLFS